MAPKVTITSTVVDTIGIYDYTPFVLGNIAWWTTARNGVEGPKDAIVAAAWKARPPRLSRAYQRSGKLVADPCAIKTRSGYTLLHTVGDLDGHRNGVGWVLLDQYAEPLIAAQGMLLAQSPTPGTYGLGQPSVATLPTGRRILVCRDDGADPGLLRAWWLLTDGRSIGPEITFDQPEVAASPEAFWWQDRLWIVVCGGGVAGLRSYRLEGDRLLVRERELDQPGEWWRTSTAISDMIDGAGIERHEDGTPIITDGHLTIWQGVGASGYPGAERTWRLTQHRLALP